MIDILFEFVVFLPKTLIKDLSKIGNRKISDSNNSLYEITLALYVLNNFDKIVGNLLKGYI